MFFSHTRLHCPQNFPTRQPPPLASRNLTNGWNVGRSWSELPTTVMGKNAMGKAPARLPGETPLTVAFSEVRTGKKCFGDVFHAEAEHRLGWNRGRGKYEQNVFC